MDKKLKVKWLKALRSGRYKQTKERLRDGIGYCCLGVLCTIQGAKWKPDPGHDDGTMIPFLDGIDIRRSGGQYVNPRHAGGLSKKTQVVLAKKNDGEDFATNPMSFKQIADYVEKRL